MMHDIMVDGTVIGLAIAVVRFGEHIVKRAFRTPHRLSEHEYKVLVEILDLCKKSHLNTEVAASLIKKML